MLKLFEYNWQVRKDWFDWCDSVTEKELLKQRIGEVFQHVVMRSQIYGGVSAV